MRTATGRLAVVGTLVVPLSACTLAEMGEETGSVPEVAVAEWNALYKNNATNIGRGAGQLAGVNPNSPNQEGADIITFQELHQKADRQAVKEALIDCDTCEYDAFFSEKAPDLGIAWKKAMLELVGRGHDIQVHGKLHFRDGGVGGGGGTISDRHIVWAELVHKSSGIHFVIANTHVLPSITLPDRQEYFERHMKALRKFVAEMKERNLPVILTLDGNANFHKEEYKKLFEAMGFAIIWVELGFPESGTHGKGKRVIDGILDLDSKDVTLQPIFVTKWPDANGSDHYPTYGIYRFDEITSSLS